MINLGDNVPCAVEFDECVKVRIVCANRVILHIKAHHCRRWRYREYVEPSLDVWRGAVLFDKFVEVLYWAAEQLAIGEAIDDSILVEGLGEVGDVAYT
jgi:hypothetical protein